MFLATTAYPSLGRAQDCSIDEQAAPEVKAKARELHSEYLAAVDANDWKKAWVAAQQAYSLNPCWKIALNLGIAAVETRRYVQGARLLKGALLTCRHDCPAPVRSAGEEHLGEAQANVGRLRIATDIENAVVLVDGKRLTERESQGYYVEPGKHFIVVRGSHESRERPVSVAKGELATVELNRQEEDTVDARQPVEQGTPDKRPPDRRRSIVLYSGIGLTTVATGFSVAFLANAGARQADINELRAEIADRDGSCVNAADSGCDDLSALAGRRDSATTRAQVASVTAGVFGLATLGVLLFWPKANSTSVEVNVGPRSISFSGTF